MSDDPAKSGGKSKKENAALTTCGVVMPISTIDGCGPDHWVEVKNIITEAVEAIPEPKFTVKLVSEADDVGIIQKRIVQNIYSSDIVVCDVSGKNPNVMFELGMRLAFDKPTVIIKDDKTDYSFDTAIIEHVTYPRDLRFSRIIAFKAQLGEKVAASLKKSKEDPNHSTFLKSFGKFHVAALSEAEVPADKLIIEKLEDLQVEMSNLRRHQRVTAAIASKSRGSIYEAIQEFKEKKKVAGPCEALVGDDALYRFVEKKIDAQSIFSTKSDFITAVDDALRTMS